MTTNPTTAQMSNTDYVPYMTKGGKVILKHAPNIWKSARYITESAWKYAVKQPYGKLKFKWDVKKIEQDAKAVHDVVYMDENFSKTPDDLRPELLEYADLYVEMAKKIKLYVKGLYGEDYYYGRAYELYNEPVREINYILAKLLKSSNIYIRHYENRLEMLPENLRDLMELVDVEDAELTITPKDISPEEFKREYMHLGNYDVFKPVSEGKTIKVKRSAIPYFGALPQKMKDKFNEADRKANPVNPKHLGMYPFVIYGECWKDMDLDAYNMLADPAIEILDIVDEEHEKQKEEMKEMNPFRSVNRKETKKESKKETPRTESKKEDDKETKKEEKKESVKKEDSEKKKMN